MQPNPLIWPPTYNLRYSSRARHVNLRICPKKGLEVVVPKRFHHLQNIPKIIEQHRHWIERTQNRLNNIPFKSEEPLPKTIRLAALNQILQVHYEPSAASILFLKITTENNLIISGCVHNEVLVRKLLHKWLQRLAKNHLIPKLNLLSQQHHLPYNKVSIRHSQTHWGSCSTKKNISLSSQLLFINPELVEHVLIHELCHTKFLNHSKNFWNLFESLNPNCHQLRKQLRQAQLELPHWLLEK